MKPQKATFLQKQKKKREGISHIPSFTVISQKLIFWVAYHYHLALPKSSHKKHRYNTNSSMKPVKISVDTIPSGMESQDSHTRRLRPYGSSRAWEKLKGASPLPHLKKKIQQISQAVSFPYTWSLTSLPLFPFSCPPPHSLSTSSRQCHTPHTPSYRGS